MNAPEAPLPTERDANKNGTVLLWRGKWGWVDSPWKDVKPGEKWKRGTAPRQPEPPRQVKRAAWI